MAPSGMPAIWEQRLEITSLTFMLNCVPLPVIDVQREHVVVLTVQNFVANLNDQFIALIVEPFTVVVGDGCGFLQSRIADDHLAGYQIFPDAELSNTQR